MAAPGLFYGYPGDVNNSIPESNMYPGGRATAYVPLSASNYQYRNNSPGELGALNQDFGMNYSYGYPVGAAGSPAPSMMDMGSGAMNGGQTSPIGREVASAGTAPATSWLLFFVIFVGFVWLARRYGGGNSFGSNIKMSLYNGLFLTFWIVLILNLLKVGAAKVRIPGVSELILAA